MTAAEKYLLNAMNYTAHKVRLGDLIETAGTTSALTGALANTLYLGASVIVSAGAGVPAHNAVKGSLYLRTNGASIDELIYVATADNTWTAASLS